MNVYFPSFNSNSVTVPSVTHFLTKLPSAFVNWIVAPLRSSPFSVNAFLENLTFVGVGTSFSLSTITIVFPVTAIPFTIAFPFFTSNVIAVAT
ncbi:Uncharacterised protein [Chlamydia trachomatis]|nr:Uncharacterised protein [Chlamydia trachomatis]